MPRVSKTKRFVHDAVSSPTLRRPGIASNGLYCTRPSTRHAARVWADSLEAKSAEPMPLSAFSRAVIPSANWDVATNGPSQPFGFGVHQCLGQSLARVELEVMLETLLRRLPRLRLGVPFEELRFNEAGAVYGVQELPATW